MPKPHKTKEKLFADIFNPEVPVAELTAKMIERNVAFTLLLKGIIEDGVNTDHGPGRVINIHGILIALG